MSHEPQANTARLVRMANQIAGFFASQPGEEQAQQVAAHLNDFWSPDMRAALATHVEAGGEGLAPLAQAAAAHLRLPRQVAGQG